MKNITLLSLELENFKGVKSQLINFEKETKILGANGSGKTTIVDAFFWLFYGKDSNNRADFSIKPRDESGNEVNKLNSIVKAFISVDGTTVELQKIYKEKWTKKRGELEAVQDGHTTTYVVKGVEVKKKEYDAFVDSLVNEEVFKLITNPLFFNTNYKWEERREMLIEIVGDVTEAEVIESNSNLAALRKILEDNTIDERTKIVKQQKSAIKKQIATVPMLITEASKAKIDTSVKNKNYKVLETKVIAQSHSKQAVLLSGINSWVLAQDVAKVTTAANDNYYNTNPKRVMLKKASTLRKKNAQNGADWDKATNKVGNFKKGTDFVITGIKKSSGGTPRLITQSGHLLTANKSYVKQTTATATKQYYTVKSGDNVESIAKKYSTTTAKIKSLNKLSDVNKIYIGQKLQVK